MDRAEVAVRRPQHTDEKTRVGTVLSRSGTVATVRWDDDGSVEDVRLGTQTLLAVVGTLRHRSLVDRAALAERFTADPLGFIVEFLRESGKALKAVVIKEQLVELGLEKVAVDKAWESAQPKLSASADVYVQKIGKVGVYRWAGPAEEAAVDKEAGEVAQAPSSESAEEIAQADVSFPVEGQDEKDVAVQSAEASPSLTSTRTPSRRMHGQDVSAKRMPAPDTSTPLVSTPSVRETLAEMLGGKPTDPLESYAGRPLRAGIGLGKLEDSAIDTLLATADRQEFQLIQALLLAAPRPLGTLDTQEVLDRLGPAVLDAIVRSATEELRKAPKPLPSMRVAAAWLMRRVASSLRLPDVVPSTIAELALHLSADPQKSELEALDVAGHLFARVLRKPLSGPVDMALLARVVRPLPLTDNGGRAALMAAVGRLSPDDIAEDRWWSGVTVQDLSGCAQGALRQLLSCPTVIGRIVGPLLVRELADVTTRTRLSIFLGLPAVLAEHLPAPSVADAFRRVATQDLVVEGWADALSGRARLEVMRRELSRAADEARAAIDLAEAAERRAGELEERCARLEQDLRGAHGHAIALRGAQERQVKIDVIRALADLAAEIEELSAGGTDPDLVVERVHGLVGGQGLEPIGRVGDAAAFDPALHEPLVGFPELGTRVRVMRPGYRWSSSDEEVLLQKALIEPT
ncbi:hypothetical protein [Sphaerisporangium aureirubrum]|uniref:Nucleotide exchange factor GrpE n=1 Tax=Sphaerisporangium aureirubrum TaxID=1544736 RepID=A0ABW1NLI2_9ACTN